MKSIRTLSIILLSFFITSSYGQISLKGIKNKASNAMEDALERKIEQEMDKAAQRVVDKYWERVLGKYYSGLYDNSGSTASGSTASFPFIIDENVELEEEYVFNHAVKMRIDTYKKNGKLDETVFMNNHTSHEHAYLGTSIEEEDGKQGEDIFIINDFENNALIMLMESDGQKMRLAYSIALDEEAAKEMEKEIDQERIEYESEVKPVSFETIGTKDILGFPCKGYRQDTEETLTEIWLAHEDVFGMDNLFGAKGMDGDQADKLVAAGYPQGSLMEWSSLDKETKQKTIMTIVEIDDNIEVAYNMDDYPSSAELQEEETEE